jgi:hypothetical protein
MKRPGKEPEMEENKDKRGPQEPEKGYSRKARLLAWAGVAFMVFLVIMYTYSLASGAILEF